MKRGLALLALALAVLPLAQGCKKSLPPPVIAVRPTPTPVPLTETLAYTRLGALWMGRADGTDQHMLAAPGRGESYWMPTAASDGGLLAWLSKPDGTQDVVHVGLAGRVTPLTAIGENADPAMKNSRLGNSPALSPDGKHIAYSFNGDIWLMDANGYNAVTLISDGSSWSPVFSPDGKRLAYVNGDDSHYDLWVSDLDSRDTYQVTDFEGYSVGQPQWTPNGQRILLTRIRGDESDLVSVLASTDTPLADADMVTRDHRSANGIFSPDGTHLLFDSGRDDPAVWNLYLSDVTGAGAKPVTQGGAMNPCWVKAAAVPAATAAARPVPAAAPTAAKATPAQHPTSSVAPAHVIAAVPLTGTKAPNPAAAPGLKATAVPSSPKAETPIATNLAKSAAPLPPVRMERPAPKGPRAPVPAPTQPPLKASPLRLRYRASFDTQDRLTLAALVDLNKLSHRVQQYGGQEVLVFGPLDNGPLHGRYASTEDRSRARAQAVAVQVAKEARMDPASVKALPYSPPLGSGASNSIQVYVELK